MKKKLINILKKRTEKNPIKREDLCKALQTNDGILRATLKKLRVDYPICNYQDGRGYFMATTRKQAQRQYLQEKARALNILRGLKGLNKVAENKTEFEKALNKLLNIGG